MKINIGKNNKIQNSNIGENNSTQNTGKKDVWKIIVEIITGILVAIISGFILFKLNWN